MSENNTSSEISLAEELILLTLDEKTGYLEIVPGWEFSCVMAGAIIADLALKGRIDTDLESLYLIDAAPTGDKLLDVTLQDITTSNKVRDAQFWIEKNANRVDDVVSTSFDRLVDRGVLVRESGEFFGLARSVSRSGLYPYLDSSRREAKARILDVILHDTLPDPRDAILIALLHACGGFKILLEEEDYEESLERIELVSKLDLLGRTVATAVQNSAVQPRRKAPKTKPIPKIGFLEIFKHRDFLRGYIPRGLHRLHSQHGSVIKLPYKMQGFPTYLMTGAEANQWINKNGRFYFRSKEYIKDFENAFGSTRTLPGLDGADHYRMRKGLKGVYSRSAIGCRLPEMYYHSRRSMSKWKEGDELPVMDTLRSYMSDQVSHLVYNVDCSHFSDELLDFQHRALIVHTMNAFPKFMIKTRKMKRYRKRVAEFQEMIISSHTPGQRKGQPMDIADGYLELHKNDPQFVSETDLTFSFVAGMVASIYLGSGISLALYCMIRNPEIHDAIYQEAEKLFGNGRTPEDQDFCPRNTDITLRLMMEATRMYPVIPWQVRAVVNRCVFDGYEIPSRSRVLIGHTATHYNSDFFKEPYKFDIDRYLPERSEHTQPGAYMPYGLGTHTCLGRRYTDLQIAVNLMLIAYHFKLEILPKEGEIKINPLPNCHPRKYLKFRVAEIRNPIPTP